MVTETSGEVWRASSRRRPGRRRSKHATATQQKHAHRSAAAVPALTATTGETPTPNSTSASLASSTGLDGGVGVCGDGIWLCGNMGGGEAGGSRGIGCGGVGGGGGFGRGGGLKFLRTERGAPLGILAPPAPAAGRWRGGPRPSRRWGLYLTATARPELGVGHRRDVTVTSRRRSDPGPIRRRPIPTERSSAVPKEIAEFDSRQGQ